MAVYVCDVCGYVYDEEKEGQLWEDLPDDWACPVCASDKSLFSSVEPKKEEQAALWKVQATMRGRRMSSSKT